jgi:hypothetical protein
MSSTEAFEPLLEGDDDVINVLLTEERELSPSELLEPSSVDEYAVSSVESSPRAYALVVFTSSIFSFFTASVTTGTA